MNTTTMTCAWCEEQIAPDEPREFIPEFNGHPLSYHYECWFRQIVGSVAHHQRRCGCFVRGSSEGDPEGMTRRQAARASQELWNRLELLGVRR